MTANRVAPWLDDGDLTLYHGNALSVLQGLPAGIAQTCVTSPPYWGLRSYLDDGHADKHVELGLEATPTEYVQNMVRLFREVRRVLRDDGTLWLNLGDSYVSNGFWPDAPSNQGESKSRSHARGRRGSQITSVGGLKPKDLVGIPWAVAKAMQEPYYTGKISDERDRIWLAAIVEAEGCLFIHKRKAGTDSGATFARKDGTTARYTRTKDTYGVGLEVASTDRVIVERCMAITGLGSICEQTPEQNTRRKQTIYRWNLRTNECRDVIRELYPHMIAKQHEARLLIGCPSSGDDARKAHESLKALHQGQAASIDFREPEGMWERGWFLRSEIIWAKCMPNPMPESVTDRPTKAHEYLFLFSKQPRYFYDADAIREDATCDRLRGPALHGDLVSTNGNSGLARRDSLGARNRRSVWVIPTQPFPEAHFATYPEELVRPCILAGTSEKGECVECRAPWTRQVERTLEVQANRRDTRKSMRPGADMKPEPDQMGSYHVETTGWEPSCSCDAAATPQLVLDPFIGSGTTSLVARKHGRRSLGIDLSAEYLEIAAKRTQQLSLLGGAA